MSDYTFHQVNGVGFHDHLMPLCRDHYAEMRERLEADGIAVSDFNPRTDAYIDAMNHGNLLTYLVIHEGAVVGYSFIWLSSDMHNGDFIAREDTVFVAKPHRKGVGKRLVKFILDDLNRIGVKRLLITPATDLRVGKIWKRMGFKPAAELMIYEFEGHEHVRT